MQTIEEVLAEHPFFRDLEPQWVALVAGCGRIVHFRPGEDVFREGEPADRFYVLRHGSVAVQLYGPATGGVTIETAHDGDVLGWSWLFPPYRWTFDARAVTDTSAIALDGTCLRGKCDSDPAFGYAMMKRFAEIMQRRLLATRLRLLDVYSHGVPR